MEHITMSGTAVSYLRVSGLGQTSEDKDGLPRQRDAVVEACKQFGLQLADDSEYADEGRTGDVKVHGFISLEELAHRESLIRLLQDLQTKRWGENVTAVLEKLERLARWQPLQEILICELARTGAKISTLAEGPGLETRDPVKVFVRQIMGSVAQLDKSQIVDKLAKARKRRKSLGERMEGRKPYGEHPKYPQEREIRDVILACTSQGLGCTDVADLLNARGFKTRKGTPWTTGGIWRIQRRLSA